MTKTIVAFRNFANAPIKESSIIRMGGGDLGWINLAQDTDGWRAVVNKVTSRRVP